MDAIGEAKAFGGEWKRRLGGDPLATQVMAALAEETGLHVQPVLDRASRQNAAVEAIIVSDHDKTQAHVIEHFRALVTLPTDRIAELGDNPVDFVRVHGIRRARARVPLTAVLQGYRAGHKVFWRAICTLIERLSQSPEDGLRAAVLMSDYCIDYTNLISNILTESYMAEEALLSAQRTRLSMAVLDDLLKGQAPGTLEGAEFCTQRGIGEGRRLVAAILQPGGSGDVSDAARALGAAQAALHVALDGMGLGWLIDIHGDEIVLIAASDGDTGRRLAELLRGAPLSLRVGVGLDVEHLALLPRSRREAATALAMRPDRVAHLADLPVGDYLRLSADETAQRLVPCWSVALQEPPLAETLEAYAAASMNIKLCAARLGVHGNTIYHRLARVRRLTGVDPRSFAGLSQILDSLAVGRPPLS